MAVTDWVHAQTFLKLSGSATWGFEENIVDGNEATSGTYAPGIGPSTYSARFTNFDGLAALIPSGATINGIEFRYKAFASTASVTETTAQVTLSGTTNGDNNASGSLMPTGALTFITIPASGGDTATWNHTPTVADRDAVIDSTFGIDITWSETGSQTLSVSIVQCRVYYTAVSIEVNTEPDAPWLVYGVHPRGVWDASTR